LTSLFVDLGGTGSRLGDAAVSSDWGKLPTARMDLRSA